MIGSFGLYVISLADRYIASGILTRITEFSSVVMSLNPVTLKVCIAHMPVVIR